MTPLSFFWDDEIGTLEASTRVGHLAYTLGGGGGWRFLSFFGSWGPDAVPCGWVMGWDGVATGIEAGLAATCAYDGTDGWGTCGVGAIR